MVVFVWCPFSYFLAAFIKMLNLIAFPLRNKTLFFGFFRPAPPTTRLTFAALVLEVLFSFCLLLPVSRPERICRSSSSKSHNRSVAGKKKKQWGKKKEGCGRPILPRSQVTYPSSEGDRSTSPGQVYP